MEKSAAVFLFAALGKSKMFFSLSIHTLLARSGCLHLYTDKSTLFKEYDYPHEIYKAVMADGSGADVVISRLRIAA